jgi:hypothetical protein
MREKGGFPGHYLGAQQDGMVGCGRAPPRKRSRNVARSAKRRFFCTRFLHHNPRRWGLGLCACEAASAQECLPTQQQLLQKQVSNTWKEVHQKDNQPLLLTISAGQGDQLQFVGKKPDGSTWISGALSICASAANQYQVKLDRVDRAPFLLAHQLTGMAGTVAAGSSRLKFGTGKRCGNPDPYIEFAAE